jgi:fructoselysine-6-P-deglycase FrlB-like protein
MVCRDRYTQKTGDSLNKPFAQIDTEKGENISDKARSVLYLPFLQFYGYYTSMKNGLNPDSPCNLTQVVRL